MRPTYETEANRTSEEVVCTAITKDLNLFVQKMPGKYSEIDRCLIDDKGDIQGVTEIKCRNIAYNQYPTIMISVSKLLAGMKFKELGLSFWLTFKYTDGFYMYMIKDPSEYEYKWGGRTAQTRDSGDIEPMAHIPMDSYTIRLSS